MGVSDFLIIRKKIYTTIEKDSTNNPLSRVYDILMIAVIVVSIIPLMFKNDHYLFTHTESVCVVFFIADYILRWATCDFRTKRSFVRAFAGYPLTPFAVIDLLSILPAFGLFNRAFMILRICRLLKIVRLLRLARYSQHIEVLLKVLHKERKVLLSVLAIAASYIFITALIMFNTDQGVNTATGEENFPTFFKALYWATVTLTTVGYGDVCPATDIGRFISMLSSLFGVAIIALPSGVITASYMSQLKENQND